MEILTSLSSHFEKFERSSNWVMRQSEPPAWWSDSHTALPGRHVVWLVTLPSKAPQSAAQVKTWPNV